MFDHSLSGSKKDVLRDRIAKPKLLDSFDFVIIDTAPSLDNLLVNALVASDYVLLPFQPHFLSLEGIKSLTRVFFRVASYDNPSLKLLGLIPVMINARIQHHNKIKSTLSTNFGSNRMFSGIRTDIKVVEAFENKMPVIFYAPNTRASVDIKLLTDEILQKLEYFSLQNLSI